MFKRIVVGATIAAASWAAYYNIRRWWATWGVDSTEAAGTLAGDELVPSPTVVDTRGITIEAPPEAVWPWLVQMGFGRGGWYSYDQLDMKGHSASTILPEHQALEVGDVLPTHADGGFSVRLVEPDRALVVYLDTATVEGWGKKAGDSISKTETPGLAMSGGFLQGASSQEFAASWAFVLQPLGEHRTRLIERTRVWFGSPRPGSRMLSPMLGFGVFVMTQRQMLGIRERAERHEMERRQRAGTASMVARTTAAQVAPARTEPHPNGSAAAVTETMPGTVTT